MSTCGEHIVRSAPFFVGSVIKMEYTIYHNFSSKTSPTKLLGFWTTISTGYLDLLSVFLLAKHLMSSSEIGGSSKQVILYEILPHWKHFSPVNHQETECVQGSCVCFCYSSSQAWNLCSPAVENDNKSHDSDARKKSSDQNRNRDTNLAARFKRVFQPWKLNVAFSAQYLAHSLYYNKNTIFNNRESVHHTRNMSKAVQNKM